jgi:hypothetical protein
MNKNYCEHIRFQYRYQSSISYQFAIERLMAQGFTEYAADQYLFAEI